MAQAERPLSPHLQVYRWQLTSVLSILHRATGVGLSLGTILLVWWLVAAAEGPEAYAGIQRFLGSWIGLYAAATLVVFLILIVATLTLSLLLRHTNPGGGLS